MLASSVVQWKKNGLTNGWTIKKIVSCGMFVVQCTINVSWVWFALIFPHFTSHFPDFFLRSDISFSPFSPIFFDIGQGFVASPGRRNPEYPGLKVIFHPNLRSDNEDRTLLSDLKKSEKNRGKNTWLKSKRPGESKSEELWSDSCGARRLRG